MSMEKIIIYKNKGETFRCQLNVEGAKSEDTIIRLCIELSEMNLFFKGNLYENGECVIEIPKLKELKDQSGEIYIEVIADSTYFKVYEAEVSLQNSVDVKFSGLKSDNANTSPSVKLKDVETKTENNSKVKVSSEEEEENSKSSLIKQKPIKTDNPYISPKQKTNNLEVEEKSKSRLSSFSKFRKNR
jgi:hypothetical protein